MKYFKYYLLVFGLIALDQAVKLWVHQNMPFGLPGEIPVFGDWFKLHYTLNEGMAFGVKFGSMYGKLALTGFRIIAICFITYYFHQLIKVGKQTGLAFCAGLVLAGAIGNAIDSTFYGVYLNNAPVVAELPPFYPYFHGQVIDMFYLDIWEGYVPENIPLLGGKYLSLWPIFNVADAVIFVGITVILFRQKAFFEDNVISVPKKDGENASATEASETLAETTPEPKKNAAKKTGQKDFPLELSDPDPKG